MSFLLDTNIISEVRKREACDRAVRAWYEIHSIDELYISVLTIGEIRKGAEACRLKDVPRARAYDRWLKELESLFQERILPVTLDIAKIWGSINGRMAMPAIDGLLAATAAHHRLTVATRNEKDFQRTGVDFINPFED